MNKDQQQSFSVEEFIEKLESEEGRAIHPLWGMLKWEEGNLLFAHGVHCANWVRLPQQHVERIEILHYVPCRDHSHPLCRVFLRRAASEEAQVFSDLLTALASKIEPPQPAQAQAHGASGLGPMSLVDDRRTGNPQGYLPLGTEISDDLGASMMTCGSRQRFHGACVSNCACLMPTMNGWRWFCCNSVCC
jgi:hypothetical protein